MLAINPTLMMRGNVALFVGSALVLALAAPPVASAAEVHLDIEGRDSGCPEARTFCFVVTSGQLADLKGGVSGTITFTNKGLAEHELKVVALSAADPAHKATSEEHAFATSKEDMKTGTSDTFSFSVPSSAGGVYIFCGVSGHEGAGMWLDSTAGTKGSPLSIALVPIALAVALALAQRRRE